MVCGISWLWEETTHCQGSHLYILAEYPYRCEPGSCRQLDFALGLMVIRDCGSTVGYWCNYINPGQLGKLTFTGGVAGTVTGQVLGNIGNLNQPHCFSELFRQNDTLYAYITNRPGTLTRLTFPPCTNSSVPSSTAFNPPVYSYNSPGTYNVSLLVDEGLPTQGTACQTITVMAPPVVNLGPNISLCQGATATLNAGPGFSSYLWSTGATSQSITVVTAGSYWVKVTKYGCEDYDTIAVTYFPAVSLNLGPDTIVCQGSSYTFNAGACAGCSYLWGNLTTGNPNIGTGSTYTTGTAGTYMVTKTDANGCVKRDTATLSTTPVPSMTLFPLSGSICSGSTTSILLTANLPGTTFTWTATLVSGIVTGFSGGTGSVIAQTLTNPGTIQGVVNYTITPHKGSCTGSPVIYAMTVKPAPIITNNPASDSLCSGGTTNVVLQSSVPGSTFAWTATASSPDVTGYSGGSGPVITQTLFNSGSMLQGVNYQVVASALGCNSPQLSYTMFVKPIPDLVITPAISAICPLSLTNVTLSSGVTGTTFSWIASGSSPMVSGYFDGSGNLISQFLYNTGFSTETVIYSVTPAAAGCLGLTDTATIRVNPTPDVSASPQVSTICSGDVTGISLSSSVTGTTYSWTCTASSGSISGFLDGSGSSIAQQLFNTGPAVGSVTYQVIAAANGCPGDTTLCVVNVNPLPTATFSPTSLAVCSGSNTGIQLSSPFQALFFHGPALPHHPISAGFTRGAEP